MRSGEVVMVPSFAGSDRSSVACMRTACADASTATTAPRSSPRCRAGRAIVRWVTSGSLKAVLERCEEGALRERMEQEVFPIQQIVHAERRAPVLVHAEVRLGVHYEPLREALVGVVA